MKITYRECDACGNRAEWKDDHTPTDWATLTVAGKPALDVCPVCITIILDAAEKRKKS